MTRLIFIFTSPYAYHSEEVKVTSLAVDLIRGKLRLPFFGYLDSPHSGGSIFAAISAIPFFLILGNTYLAQKITALIFSLLTFILFLRLFKKNYPMIFVYLLGLFFCFSTPHYIQKSVMHEGDPVDLILFLTFAIYIFYNIFFENKKGLLNFFNFGVVCGFGFWLHYGQSTVIVTLLIFWFAFDKLFSWTRG